MTEWTFLCKGFKVPISLKYLLCIQYNKSYNSSCFKKYNFVFTSCVVIWKSLCFETWSIYNSRIVTCYDDVYLLRMPIIIIFFRCHFTRRNFWSSIGLRKWPFRIERITGEFKPKIPSIWRYVTHLFSSCICFSSDICNFLILSPFMYLLNIVVRCCNSSFSAVFTSLKHWSIF